MDHGVMRFVVAHRTALLDRVARGLMTLGTSRKVALAAVVLAVAWVVRTRRWRTMAAVVFAVVGAEAVTLGLKAVIGRPRPPFRDALVHASGPSMPSTDAAVTIAAAIAVWAAVRHAGRDVRRAALAVLVVVVLAVGWAVVYLGAHWTTDVLAGWVVGAAVGLAVVRMVGPTPGRLVR